jgi:hypothetical protein
MIFIIRTQADQGPPPDRPAFEIKMVRQTPAIVPDSAGRVDFFCLGDPEAARAAGWTVVPVHDGWYANDQSGGMAIWGQGMFWEVRDTPFTVKQACGSEAWPHSADKLDKTPGAEVNVRQTIFGG